MTKGRTSNDPLKGLRILAADYESYWANDYHLRRKELSTSLYVRHKRFKAHCLAAMFEDDPYPRRFYGHDEIEKFLKTVDWKKTAWLSHHTHFDGLIASHHFGVKPAFWLDTLSMARALHGSHERNDLDSLLQRYGRHGKLNDVLKHTKNVRDLPPVLASMLGDYACQDIADLVYVFKQMRPQFPNAELAKIDMFIRMFAEPILGCDRRRAAKAMRAAVRDREEAVDASGEEIEDLRSRESFAELLREAGVEPPLKWKKRKNGEKYQTYAFAKTDRDFQALRDSDNKRVRELVKAKLAASSTIEETRAEALLERSEDGMRLPIYLNYAKAHTLRTSGGDSFNPQNFPARQSGELKRCIVAPPGYEIVVCDSAQIECRVNADYAGQEDLLDAFRNKRDVYAEMASEIYGKPINKKDNPDERFIGKTTVLGAGYQMSGGKFQVTLAQGTMGPPVFVERDVADDAINAFRRKNYKIVAQWTRLGNMLTCMARGQEQEWKYTRFVKGGIEMPNGLRLRYPNLRWRPARDEDEYDGWVYGSLDDDKAKSLYGGMLDENIVQSLSYIIVSDQALEISRRYRVVMFTHDEVVFLARKREAKSALAYAIETMSIPPKWSPELPLAAEGCYAGYYRKPD